MSFDALLDADFKTPPWHHQLREFEISAELPARALLWQMRTGKSKFTLDTASHLFRAGLIDCILIFAPNGVHANWVEREVPRHLWDGLDHVTMAWRTRIAGLKGGNRLSKADLASWEDAHADWWRGLDRAMKDPALLIVSFNSESTTREDVRKVLKKLLGKRRILCVWDEASDYRSPGAARTKQHRALARHVAYRRILDGTLAHNSALHVFSPFELLEYKALGYSSMHAYVDKEGHEHDGFEDRYAEFRIRKIPGRKPFPELKGYKNLEELREKMARLSSVVLREDCEDLPAVMPHLIEVAMSEEQERLYEQVKERILIEFEAGELASIGAQTSRLLKLQQVASGFLVDEDRKVHRLQHGNPRLERLAEEVFFSPGKSIVWCQFQEDLDAVSARLRDDGLTVMEYHGRTKEEDKAKVRRDFPKAGKDTVLVAQVGSAARGLELPADWIFWYSHTNNNILRNQANERATIMGGKNVNLADIVAAPVDRYILDTLANNTDIAQDLAGRGLRDILRSL